MGAHVARVTITLKDELYRSLKESAARRGTTIGGLVAESLEFYGIKSREDGVELVARVRKRSGLGEDEALEIAVSETRSERAT